WVMCRLWGDKVFSKIIFTDFIFRHNIKIRPIKVVCSIFIPILYILKFRSIIRKIQAIKRFGKHLSEMEISELIPSVTNTEILYWRSRSEVKWPEKRISFCNRVEALMSNCSYPDSVR